MLQIPDTLFNSFFWGGFEAAAPKLSKHKRIDILRETLHDREDYCTSDYKRLKELGISTVREGLIWSSIDKGTGEYDFSRFESMMKIAKQKGIQQVWDLNHFEYPDDILNPFSNEFVERFRNYAVAAYKTIRKYQTGTLYIVSINEMSFWSWISAEEGVWAPFKHNRGTEWKKFLVKATIAAMDAIWEIDSDVRFIQVDPLAVRLPQSTVDIRSKFLSRRFRRAKFEAWDMLAGKIYPELGGNPKYLDLLGVNYYNTNQQWIILNDIYQDINVSLNDYRIEKITMESSRRSPFRDLVQEVFDRYKRPIIITETGSYGDLRVEWWAEILKEVDEIKRDGIIPLLGICAYPIIDRKDWVLFHLTNSGFWDYVENDVTCQRIPKVEVIEIVKKYIDKWK